MRKKRIPLRKYKGYQPWWLRFFRYWYIRLLRLQGHPKEIARGLAVGVFSGAFPWLGLQIIIAVLLAVVFRGNKLAAAAATWISNPFTSIPIFLFNFKIGQLVLGGNKSIDHQTLQVDLQSWSNLIESGFEVILSLFIGSFVVGIIAGFCIYFISLRIIIRWRESRLND